MEQMSDNKDAPCMFTCKGVFLLPHRTASDRMQAVFIITCLMTIDSGMELKIYLERFRNVEYCRSIDIDVEPKILENCNCR